MPSSSCKKSIRHIPAQPERILDAPEILDDYCKSHFTLLHFCKLLIQFSWLLIFSSWGVFVVDLSLLDWNCCNILAVALAGQVFLWNATTGDIQQLLEMEAGQENYVSSVNWSADGNSLAVGTSTSEVQVCVDVITKKATRNAFICNLTVHL